MLARIRAVLRRKTDPDSRSSSVLRIHDLEIQLGALSHLSFYHQNRPEVLAVLAGEVGSSQRNSRTLDKRMMYAALPLNGSGPIQGILRTSTSLADVDAELGRIQSRIAFGGFLIADLASVICFIVPGGSANPSKI